MLEHFSKLCQNNSSFIKNLARITDKLCEDVCTSMIITCWILVRIRNVSDKLFTENQNTCFVFNNFF